jgi:dTMP kinase
MKGLLVTLEGQDGSGKSTLMKLVAEKLKREGFPTITIDEFSKNVVGLFLRDALEKNKFLRLNPSGPSALTETSYILADLHSQDESEIRPAIGAGAVVIKERHIDSVLACQIPKIVDDYPQVDLEKLFMWLSAAVSMILSPDVTFFLDVREEEMVKRIRGRGESVSETDMAIFRRRQTIYDRLGLENCARWYRLQNNGTPGEAVCAMVACISEKIRNQV